MTSLVRSSALSGYSELVQTLGGQPAPLLARCGIRKDIERVTDGFLPYRALIRLLEVSADVLRCPDFGMRFAMAQDIGILGPLAVAIRHATTMREAVEQTARYLHVFNPGQRLSVSAGERRGEVRLRFEILLEQVACQRQADERALCFVHQLLALGGPEPSPSQVFFSHACLAPLRAYIDVFGAAVLRFDEPVCCIDIDASALDNPMQDANRQIRAMAIAYLERATQPRHAPFTTRVDALVRRVLATGELDIDLVANALHLTRRTLQRRLAAEKTDFTSVVDDVRCELAQRYLAHGDLPFTQVAALLGYTEQSAFNRACRRWLASTPKAYRRGAVR